MKLERDKEKSDEANQDAADRQIWRRAIDDQQLE